MALRHHIHQHPELGFEEYQTSDLVAAKLQSWGYAVNRGIGGTGLVAVLQAGHGPRRLGLRADMDALPIQEQTGLPYSSVYQGKMHACGHDGHTAMLLGAARYLAATRQFSGTLQLIFQPAEEGLAGARRMLDDGLFERFPCDAIFAMHNMPGFPERKLVFHSGAFMASSDRASITLTGKGGHGAEPHKAIDPVVAAASIVLGLQTIVARNVDAQHPAVITVGSIKSGEAPNVIPQSAHMELSIRALDAGVRDLLQRRIRQLVAAQAQSFDLSAAIDYCEGYPVLVNSAAETAFAQRIGEELVGADNIICDTRPLMGSEDFAYLLQHCPGSYLLIGNGAGEQVCTVHNSGYDFNDRCIVTGAAYWAHLTERFLS
ncbi:M20 aminoacylase family protein [Collimonas silvisoli]|uniref:M20 aminoacylase family protein n=1 Tax=Collimonas silvisoli TaxID=2825884 RepID=UPI001B8CB46C|nr:M20 aminoacylase family protein [Collimonas silvisoli]